MNKKLYSITIKASREATNDGICHTCFCSIVKNYLRERGLEESFLKWKIINCNTTVCSSILFYLEDLGIIKILQGVEDRNSGVDCRKLRYTISKQGNKI